MATKTYYFDDTDITAATLDTLSESAPSAADNFGAWKVGKGSTDYAWFNPDTQVDSWGAKPTIVFTYGYRTTGVINGTFASGSWVFDLKVQSSSLGGQQNGYIHVGIGKSSNADGTSSTTIKDWFSSAEIDFTATDQTKTVQITVTSVPETTFTNEYLFIAFIWQRSASGGHNNAVVNWIHNEGAAEQFVTTDFTAGGATLVGTLLKENNLGGDTYDGILRC